MGKKIKNTIGQILVIGVLMILFWWVKIPPDYTLYILWPLAFLMSLSLYKNRILLKNNSIDEVYVHLYNDDHNRIFSLMFGFICLAFGVIICFVEGDSMLDILRYGGVVAFGVLLILHGIFFIPSAKLAFSENGLMFTKGEKKQFFLYSSLEAVTISEERIIFVIEGEKQSVKQLGLKAKEIQKIKELFGEKHG